MIAYVHDETYPFTLEDGGIRHRVVAYLTDAELTDLLGSGSLLGEHLRNEKMEAWVQRTEF